jgi:hypothetical protein
VTEMARIAADKLDISVKIEFPPGFVVLTQDSLLGEKVCAAADRDSAMRVHNPCFACRCGSSHWILKRLM